ncbi:hypothetical protein AAG747_24435 [Rapidithrix thailandica]|uniref:Uncharacterized protein n=1 Tax=Rapidithrix thailandica TaxID=413964 RepID=A0AAW9SCB1_9BACT
MIKVIKSGFWKSTGGNPFWIKVIENNVFGLGMNNVSQEYTLGEKWCHVGKGEIQDMFLYLEWSDIPGGTDELNGKIKVETLNETRMKVVEDSGSLGLSTWNRVSNKKDFADCLMSENQEING